jgi:hypothetical protein
VVSFSTTWFAFVKYGMNHDTPHPTSNRVCPKILDPCLSKAYQFVRLARMGNLAYN